MISKDHSSKSEINENSGSNRKKTNLTIFLVIISLLCLFYSNPTVASFRSYIRQHARESNGPLSSIVSHFNVWYAKRTNSLKSTDFLFFTVVQAPPYLLEEFQTASDKNCIFIGAVFNWFPICYSSKVGKTFNFAQCSYKGIPLNGERCVCLPSWCGADCSRTIINFQPFLIRNFNSCLLYCLNYVSVLEFVLLLVVTYEVYFIMRPGKRAQSLCTWNGIADDWKFSTLFSHSFVHKNFLHSFFSFYCFLAYAPQVYQVLGNRNFVAMILAVMLLSNVVSMTSRRLKNSFTSTKYLGLSALIVALRSMMVYATLTWKDSMLYAVGQTCMSHLVLEYILIGDSIDYEGIVCGLLSGLFIYKCI